MFVFIMNGTLKILWWKPDEFCGGQDFINKNKKKMWYGSFLKKLKKKKKENTGRVQEQARTV